MISYYDTAETLEEDTRFGSLRLLTTQSGQRIWVEVVQSWRSDHAVSHKVRWLLAVCKTQRIHQHGISDSRAMLIVRCSSYAISPARPSPRSSSSCEDLPHIQSRLALRRFVTDSLRRSTECAKVRRQSFVPAGFPPTADFKIL